MRTKIELQESKANGHADRLAQMQRLINGLAPDPSEWEYTGQCHDLGKPVGYCACGHEIRYEFILNRKRDGATAVVGSVCIDNYALISPAAAAWMRQDLERMMEEVKEAKKKAEEAKRVEEAEKLHKRWERQVEELRIREEHLKAKSGSDWIPYDMWMALYGKKSVTRIPTYQRTTGYINWYKKTELRIAELLALHK